MSPISFAQSFSDFSDRKLGVRKRHVLDALDGPGQADDISYVGETFRLYLRRVTASRVPHLLLVFAKVVGEELEIIYAIRAYFDLEGEPEGKTPTDVLALLAERFGRPFRIAGRSTKFVRMETVPCMDVASVLQGNFEKGRSSTVFFAVKFEKQPNEVAHVALGWHLDVGAYLEWVARH